MRSVKSLWQNPWTLSGAILAVLAALFFISFQIIEFLEPSNNPYSGLWSFLVLPFFLVIGLLLIPIGWVVERRMRRKLYPEIHHWPRLPRVDLNDPGHRRGVLIFSLGTLLVIPLVGISTYGGYHYTDSTQFCGQVCHSVMHPEYDSYRGSPHARVSCVECHIGSGATWYVKSKLSGVRQVFAVTLDTFPRPIPTPVRDLRPARETCEQCHWPAKFYGSQLVRLAHYASDETNSRREIRMVIKTGGGDSSMFPASGIHWHMALSQRIEYVATDGARQVIPWVRATDAAGRVTVYRSDGKGEKDPPPAGEVRLMDCMDCHNRPTHVIHAPDRAVSMSLEAGRIDRTLPYLKKVALEALTEPYATEEEAGKKIESFIREFYDKNQPEAARVRRSSINQAVEEVQAIYRRNFFPRMRVDWRAYPDNIGHMYFDGCFRCHDGKHVSDDRRVVRKECDICHEFEVPVKVAGSANVFQTGEFQHFVKLQGSHVDKNCSLCHSGGRAPDRTCEGCHTEQTRFALGEFPVLEGLEVSPSVHSGVDCEACHDLTKPADIANISPQCDLCHESGYGELLSMWKEEAADGRAAAVKAIAAAGNLNGVPRSGRDASGNRVRQMRLALERIDKAGPLHNPGLADAVFRKILQSAEAPGPPAPSN